MVSDDIGTAGTSVPKQLVDKHKLSLEDVLEAHPVYIHVIEVPDCAA